MTCEPLTISNVKYGWVSGNVRDLWEVWCPRITAAWLILTAVVVLVEFVLLEWRGYHGIVHGVFNGVTNG